MFYSKIKVNDVANGPGLRVSLFTSVCTHHCKGCFQPETWNFNNGEPYTSDVQKNIIEKSHSKYIAGLSLLGGDPLDNVEGILTLLKEYREVFGNTKTIWLWTGYTLDAVPAEILNYIDVLIDGQFIQEKYDYNLEWRGSSNQRILRKRFDFP